MTRPEIEPTSPGPLANTQPTWPMSRLIHTHTKKKKNGIKWIKIKTGNLFYTRIALTEL